MPLCLFLLLMPASVGAQQTQSPEVWGPYKFLLGEWTAEGHGEPGKGAGEFSFQLQLQDKILVRRSHLAFPPTPQRAAFAHDDLLIIYCDDDATPHRAIYFDSEGHVIHYKMAFTESGKVLSFVSDANPQEPRQRLTYIQAGIGTVKVKFELAPPGKSEAFVTHVEGVAHRK